MLRGPTLELQHMKNGVFNDMRSKSEQNNNEQVDDEEEQNVDNDEIGSRHKWNNLKKKEDAHDKEIDILKSTIAKQQESINKIMKLVEDLQAQREREVETVISSQTESLLSQTEAIDLDTIFDFEGYASQGNIEEGNENENEEYKEDKEDDGDKEEEDKDE
ncbi:hypothetical protein L1987_07002 [Smallanthus sonchifolius]|uniref:Uncharacterized protein n=1 Tax=Smallanthus sonchifolius TaxID=185202 RepID=A0ACB9JZV0_9ASTR|nr:hypothetical protein L1987_07002 [Smallanthus sonchifolius]